MGDEKMKELDDLRASYELAQSELVSLKKELHHLRAESDYMRGMIEAFKYVARGGD